MSLFFLYNLRIGCTPHAPWSLNISARIFQEQGHSFVEPRFNYQIEELHRKNAIISCRSLYLHFTNCPDNVIYGHFLLIRDPVQARALHPLRSIWHPYRGQHLGLCLSWHWCPRVLMVCWSILQLGLFWRFLFLGVGSAFGAGTPHRPRCALSALHQEVQDVRLSHYWCELWSLREDGTLLHLSDNKTTHFSFPIHKSSAGRYFDTVWLSCCFLNFHLIILVGIDDSGLNQLLPRSLQNGHFLTLLFLLHYWLALSAGKSFPFSVFIYLFTYYWYGLMASCFNQQFIIHSPIIHFDAQIFPYFLRGTPFKLSPPSFVNEPVIFGALPYFPE